MKDKEVSIAVDSQIKDFRLDFSSLVSVLKGSQLFWFFTNTRSDIPIVQA